VAGSQPAGALHRQRGCEQHDSKNGITAAYMASDVVALVSLRGRTVLAFSQHTYEIAIRFALSASPWRLRARRRATR